MVTEALERFEDRAALLYNLACAEARLGEIRPRSRAPATRRSRLRASLTELARAAIPISMRSAATRGSPSSSAPRGVTSRTIAARLRRRLAGAARRLQLELAEHAGDLNQLLGLSAPREHGLLGSSAKRCFLLRRCAPNGG